MILPCLDPPRRMLEDVKDERKQKERGEDQECVKVVKIEVGRKGLKLGSSM